MAPTRGLRILALEKLFFGHSAFRYTSSSASSGSGGTSAVSSSDFTIFFTQSKAPEYSLFLRLTRTSHAHFIICRRVFTMSTGSDTTVQKKPDVSEEAMCRPRPSCLNRCHLSKYSSFACE